MRCAFFCYVTYPKCLVEVYASLEGALTFGEYLDLVVAYLRPVFFSFVICRFKKAPFKLIWWDTNKQGKMANKMAPIPVSCPCIIPSLAPGCDDAVLNPGPIYR